MCYLCLEKGHLDKNFPNKSKNAAQVILPLQQAHPIDLEKESPN